MAEIEQIQCRTIDKFLKVVDLGIVQKICGGSPELRFDNRQAGAFVQLHRLAQCDVDKNVSSIHNFKSAKLALNLNNVYRSLDHDSGSECESSSSEPSQVMARWVFGQIFNCKLVSVQLPSGEAGDGMPACVLRLRWEQSCYYENPWEKNRRKKSMICQALRHRAALGTGEGQERRILETTVELCVKTRGCVEGVEYSLS
eukprot:3641081-Rhodomonas_salina.1